MARNKRRRQGRSTDRPAGVRARTAKSSAAGGPEAASQQVTPGVDSAVELWSLTRSGARAGRGFHYQDVVGAWLCARLVAGDLPVGQIVPEGFEDFSCEGDRGVHVQVKSRQEQVGDFTPAEVAAFVLDMAERQKVVRKVGQGGRMVLVVERPVAGAELTDWDGAIADFPDAHPVREAVTAAADRRGLAGGEVEAVMRQTGVYVLPWRAAAEQVGRVVEQRYRLPRAATEPVVSVLRNEVAGCADANAAASLESRAGLDRTRIELRMSQAAALVDRESLLQAQRDGLCEPVDFDTPTSTAGYFQGVPAQPGDITAGLPAPRPDVTGQIVAAVDRGETVLVTGPSGAGKSTVMWAAAYCTRHILWYRVRRLREGDVEPLVRLARALRPSPRCPVGFVVDGVGVGAVQAWDLLQREAAAIPGVVLLGSTRTEDLLPLATLQDCTTIPVGLDKAVAARIHEGLLATDATSTPHWRQAYAEADGLTLEFTHLLTRGMRLSQVITEQVRRRVRDGRDAELKILARVSVAHRCGADLPLLAVREQVRVDDAVFRQALARLDEEHLVRVEGARLTGLHQLRSAALAEAVHTFPPPQLGETVDAVVPLLADDQLQPFVVNAMAAWPRLEPSLMDRLTGELQQRTSPVALAGVLQALRIVDFTRRAHQWTAVLDRHQVKPAHRQATLTLAFTGGDISPGVFLPEVAAAAAEIAPTVDSELPLRDQLVARVGADRVARMVLACSDPAAALQLLAVLSGTGCDLTIRAGEIAEAALTQVMRHAPAGTFGELMSAAWAASADLAMSLLDATGGQEAVFERLRDHSRWLVEARVLPRDEALVAYARLLHIPELRPDVDEATREFARVLLLCLPMCNSADVQALLPGDLPVRVGDHTLGVSLLKRRYAPPQTEVAWMRLRSRIAAEATGTLDATTRAHTARAMVADLSVYLDGLTRMWCLSRNRQTELDDLQTRRGSLQQRTAALTLPLGRNDAETTPAAGLLAPMLANHQVPPPTSDHLYTLVSGVVDNLTSRMIAEQPHWPSLAAYTGDTLPRGLQHVRAEERWDLTDQAPPAELDTIEGILAHLHAVLAELAWGGLSPQTITTAARSGHYQQALARAAKTARHRALQRASQVSDRLLTDGRQAGLRLDIQTRPLPEPRSTDWPPVQFAATLLVNQVLDWPPAIQTLTGIINRHRTLAGPLSSMLAVPVIAGRAIRQYAVQIGQNTWPGEDLFDTWAGHLPPTQSTPLTDAVTEGYAALCTLSAVLALAARTATSSQQQDLADAQADRLQRTLQTLASFPADDPVVYAVAETLAAIAERVQAEAAETTSGDPPGSFATALLKGTLGQPTDESTTYQGTLALSLQWDVDPDCARHLVNELAQ